MIMLWIVQKFEWAVRRVGIYPLRGGSRSLSMCCKPCPRMWCKRLRFHLPCVMTWIRLVDPFSRGTQIVAGKYISSVGRVSVSLRRLVVLGSVKRGWWTRVSWWKQPGRCVKTVIVWGSRWWNQSTSVGGGIYHLASLRSLGALVSGVVCAVGGLCWNLTCVGGWGMEGWRVFGRKIGCLPWESCVIIHGL